jgi:Flp pilus assembly protein TadG
MHWHLFLTRSATRGQVLVLFGLLLPALIGTAGLFIDAAIIFRESAALRVVAAAAARAGASEISSTALNTLDVVTLNPLDHAQVQSAVTKVCEAYAREPRLSGLTCSPVVVGEPSLTNAEGAAWVSFAVDETRRGHIAPIGVKVTAIRDVRVYFLSVLTHRSNVHLAISQWATPVTGP